MFDLIKFLFNPHEFALTMHENHRDLYPFRLAGKKLFITSNLQLIKLIEKDSVDFFEPNEIIKSLGKTSLIVNNENHKYLRRKFVYALSKLDLNSISIIENERKLHCQQKNLKLIVDDLVLDININLFNPNLIDIEKKYIKDLWLKIFENLTWDVMFFPFLKINLLNTKWAKLLKLRKIFEDTIVIPSIIKKDSIPYIFAESGLSIEEIKDNSFLFFFAAFDNIILSILNTFITYNNESDFISNIDNYIQNSLKIHPPVPFIFKSITKPIILQNNEYTLEDRIFPAGTGFGIDLVNAKIDKFGIGNKKCPAKLVSFTIIKHVLLYLHRNFRLEALAQVTKQRQRFSYGPINVPVVKAKK